MTDSGPLLTTLIVVVLAAGAVAVIATLLRQPLIVGYVAAGLILGPYTPGFVADAESVEALANVGIILLLFTVGVQISIPDLMRVGRVAVFGALAQVSIMIGAGFGAGLLFGWDAPAALALGFVLSNSSSTVLTKVLSEYGEEGSTHGRIALGWSAVQDVTTVVLLVVLAAFGDEGGSLAAELARAIGGALLFIGVVVPIGFIVLPPLLERTAQLGSREVFLVAALGLALGVSAGASWFGVSPALAAFLAGVLVSRSDISHQVLGELVPLRDIFAAIFFVSVGMLVDPATVIEQPLPLLGALLIGIVLKGGVTSLLVLLAGYRGRTVVLSGIVLAQSGEFSFLLARVGAENDVISEDIFSLLLLTAVLTIIAAPALYRVGQPLGRLVERRLPARFDPTGELPAMPRNHTTLLGYGRVGRLIEQTLRDAGIPHVVVDQDTQRLDPLRRLGVPVVVGSASNPAVLDFAGLGATRILIVAIPDPIAIRQIVDYARQRRPALDIVVRTHSATERAYLEAHGVDEAVVGEFELALEMSRHALRRAGLAVGPTEDLLTQARTREEPA